VLETPADTLGVVDDMWFRWISDFGLPGADRGQGGRYLLIGPEHDGPLPEGGYYVRHSRTNHVTALGRAFINANEGNDPAPTVALIKQQLKIYPYRAGGVGSSIGGYLTGKGSLAQPVIPTSPRFVEGTGLAMNTVPPNDFGHYEMLDRLVQEEPAEALDPEIAGQFTAIGIVKNETFAPEARLREILDEAAAVGNAASRTLGMGAHPRDDFRYYDDGLVEHAFRRRLRIHQPAATDHAGRGAAVPEQGSTAVALAYLDVLHRDRHHPGHVHAIDQRGVAVCRSERRQQWRTI